MYVCPECRGALECFVCRACGLEFERVGGVPYFLAPKGAGPASPVGAIYDAIYSDHSNVWEDQGRDAAFRRYFASVVASVSAGRILEVGCGEGLLLAAIQAGEKAGIDPSVKALRRAMAVSGAECAAAQAEHLPYPDEHFDAAIAVGVMEHFSDPDAATKEIWRVLRPGGWYLVLFHTDMSWGSRARQKIREYVLPRFRPLALVTWIRKKTWKPIRQPMRRAYSTASAEDCLSRNGFETVRAITRASDPTAPLAGDHVVILVARRRPRVRESVVGPSMTRPVSG
jgi:ubiquinone/menaquinone biosynthesis C-methylase UbiE